MSRYKQQAKSDKPRSMPKTKVCTKCGKRKKLESFARRADHSTGRRAHCRACCHDHYYSPNRVQITEERKAYYAANTAAVRARNDAYRRANLEKLNARARAKRADPAYRAYYNAWGRLYRLLNGRSDSVL